MIIKFLIMEIIYTNTALILMLYILFAMFPSFVQGQGGTRVGFYSKTCPSAESIVRSTIAKHVKANPAIAPGLLRMHFHDCFVRGCDASILINGSNTEKKGLPNGKLIGYEVIEDAKTQIETTCPGIVSCADILALAARDSVVLTGGRSWEVPTGRRDGSVSLAEETGTLPSFKESIDSQKKKFASKGLNAQDLVTLVGGHTIGTSACGALHYRLYNYSSENVADPTIDRSFLPQLQALCSQNGDENKRVALDTKSEKKFDNCFFSNLKCGRGILESDQKLWTDGSTRTFVQRFLGTKGSSAFNVEFGKSMVKMSNIEVKTGSDGEIRKICSAIN